MNTVFTRGWSLEARLFYGTDFPDNLWDCWEWKRWSIKPGYGRMQVKDKMVMTHRLSYELYIGPIPVGLDVLHRCDNPPCWNPFHLWLGTDLDNSRDCVAKGRNVRGEAVNLHKLTDADIRAIRADPRTTLELGPLFGVHPSQISRIKTRRTWKHI